MQYFLFVTGIFLLVKGAGWLVEGSASLADKFGVSRLFIGLTIVSIGTTSPEFMISVFAAARSSDSVVFGNIVGSCIANILLILGVLSLITRLKVKYSTTWKEIPFAMLAVILLFIFALRPFDDTAAPGALLARTDGMVLLLFFSIFLYYIVELAKKSRAVMPTPEIKEQTGRKILALILAGITGIYFGGNWTVRSAVFIAYGFGVSEYLISATLVAAGTSLPELTTAIVAARKKKVDLAVGNVIGSNILNILWILGITSLINPVNFPTHINVDLSILLLATFLLFLFMFTSKKHQIDRWEGVLFLLGYATYIVFLIIRG